MTDWYKILDEGGDLIEGCTACHGSGLLGFDPECEKAHELYVPCDACNGEG